MKKSLSLFLLALIVISGISSCTEDFDYSQYQEPEKPIGEDNAGFVYAQKFSNETYINVNITSDRSYGCFYSVFTFNPINEEGALVGTPLFNGVTPINDVIPIPNGTDSLYVYTTEGLRTYPVGDLNLSDEDLITPVFKRNVTRTNAYGMMSDEEIAIAINMINTSLIPEKHFNVKREDLYKCTDLVIKDLTLNQTARIWATFVSNGAAPGSGVVGNFWYYTYTKLNPDIEDCTFYGKDANTGAIIKVDFEKNIRNSNPNRASGNPVFNTQTSESSKEIELDGSTFLNDTYVGFAYKGNLGVRFTTPSLNTIENSSCPKDGVNKYTMVDYLGKTIDYSVNEKFTVEKQVNSGVIFHFESLGGQYNVVGMENRLHHEGDSNTPYDADYNDCLVLIRTNPETISPLEQVAPPTVVYTSYRKGFWIFEDNYPDVGDFDFNDVVVAYDMQMFNKQVISLTCRLVAKGCDYDNEMGVCILNKSFNWEKPTFTESLFKDINGYLNVGSEMPIFTDCKTITRAYICSDYRQIRPYLDNGKGQVTLETFNTMEHPYALDIPSSINGSTSGNKTNTNFRWCQEGNSIDDAYYFLKNKNGGNRIETWYYNSQAKDASLLIDPENIQMNVWE